MKAELDDTGLAKLDPAISEQRIKTGLSLTEQEIHEVTPQPALPCLPQAGGYREGKRVLPWECPSNCPPSTDRDGQVRRLTAAHTTHKNTSNCRITEVGRGLGNLHSPCSEESQVKSS